MVRLCLKIAVFQTDIDFICAGHLLFWMESCLTLLLFRKLKIKLANSIQGVNYTAMVVMAWSWVQAGLSLWCLLFVMLHIAKSGGCFYVINPPSRRCTMVKVI